MRRLFTVQANTSGCIVHFWVSHLAGQPGQAACSSTSEDSAEVAHFVMSFLCEWCSGAVVQCTLTYIYIYIYFGVGAPPILVHFSGDWDVHWGYGLLTHGHIWHMFIYSICMCIFYMHIEYNMCHRWGCMCHGNGLQYGSHGQLDVFAWVKIVSMALSCRVSGWIHSCDLDPQA